MTTKRIGLLCLVFALLGAVSGLYLAFADPAVPDDRWSYPQTPTAFAWTQAWFAVQHIPLILGLAAATSALGPSRAGRIGWRIGLLGMVALTITELVAILPRTQALDDGFPSTLGVIYGLDTLLVAGGLMVGGWAAVRAGIWHRHEAWLLFALGAWLLVPTLPALAVSFLGARLAITGWMLLFAALGYVLWTRTSDDVAGSGSDRTTRPQTLDVPAGALMGAGGAVAREMPIIHRIFRRQFAEVRSLVETRPENGATVLAIADHLGFLLDGLHMHHTTEDDLVWPKLLDRVGLDTPLVTRMEEQHQRIAAGVAELSLTASAWRSDPTPATSATLAEQLGEFLVLLEEHLDEEERVVVPLIDLHLTEAEWKDVGERAFEKFTPAQRWIATGQLVEVATPDEVEMMFSSLPPPVKVLWHLVGKRRYRRYITPVRAGSLG